MNDKLSQCYSVQGKNMKETCDLQSIELKIHSFFCWKIHGRNFLNVLTLIFLRQGCVQGRHLLLKWYCYILESFRQFSFWRILRLWFIVCYSFANSKCIDIVPVSSLCHNSYVWEKVLCFPPTKVSNAISHFAYQSNLNIMGPLNFTWPFINSPPKMLSCND